MGLGRIHREIRRSHSFSYVAQIYSLVFTFLANILQNIRHAMSAKLHFCLNVPIFRNIVQIVDNRHKYRDGKSQLDQNRSNMSLLKSLPPPPVAL
jgi:ribosomal protein S26